MKKLILFIAILFMTYQANAAEAPMKNILIVYGSFSGSTAEIADRMKTILEKNNCSAEVLPADGSSKDLGPYDLVIIGSAIRGGSPHGGVKKFIEANRTALEKKKVAVFAACLFVISKKENQKSEAQGYADKVACGLAPASKTVFAGSSQNSWWITAMLSKLFMGIGRGDYREWDTITAWTLSLIGPAEGRPL